MLRRFRSLVVIVVLAPALIALAVVSPRPSQHGQHVVVDALAGAATPGAATTPIQHVVIIFQENHSFDNVLGAFCANATGRMPCDGATTGKVYGSTVPLTHAPDIVPNADHSTLGQHTAVDRGAMDGFESINGCGAPALACYSQYQQNDIPNLWALAQNFVISDRTFSLSQVPSWGGHMELVAAQLDGFRGDNPNANPSQPKGPGWGCDSNMDAPWHDPTQPFSSSNDYLNVPSCIPKPDGTGPYRASPVHNVPTLLERLDDASLPWKIYSGTSSDSGYIWSICPTFANCIDGPDHANVVKRTQFSNNAAAGKLPAVSFIMPDGKDSQHNSNSMKQGDNYIEGLVSAAMNGPEWASTAIFITYDDCGCFSDHVAPPTNLGIRVPMVIVSPFAKAGYTDSNIASFASMDAFVEHNWSLPPLLSNVDGAAYDYMQSFNFTQQARRGIPLHKTVVPAASQQWVKAHGYVPDDDDRT